MSLDRDQKLRYLTAGAVALPPTAPKAGMIQVEKKPGTYVRITENVSISHAIIRIVELDDIVAIRVAYKSGDREGRVDENSVALTEKKDIRAEFEKSGVRGIAFVREQAQVLTQIEKGQTAAESVHAEAAFDDARVYDCDDRC